MRGDARILVVGCKGSGALRDLADEATGTLDVVCLAQLPPPYIDYVLSRGLADGVMLAGCASGDCQYRLGARWTEERIRALLPREMGYLEAGLGPSRDG